METMYSTKQAAQKLEIPQWKLNRLILHKLIRPPARAGRGFVWLQEDIDRVVKFLTRPLRLSQPEESVQPEPQSTHNTQRKMRNSELLELAAQHC